MMFEMLVGITLFNAPTVGAVFDRSVGTTIYAGGVEDREMWAAARDEGLLSEVAEI